MDSIKIETWLRQKNALDFVTDGYDLPPHIKRVLEDMSYSIQEEYDNYKKWREDQLKPSDDLVELLITPRPQYRENMKSVRWDRDVARDPNITVLEYKHDGLLIRTSSTHAVNIRNQMGICFIITTRTEYKPVIDLGQ